MSERKALAIYSAVHEAIMQMRVPVYRRMQREGLHP